MFRKSKKKGLIDSIWLQGALLAAAAVIFWWIRRRGEKQPPERPTVWRRDIEMGPTASAGEEPQPLELTGDLPSGQNLAAGVPDVPAVPIPDLEAGDGGPIEEAERAESASLAGIAAAIPETDVPVEGPVETVESQGAETPGGDDLEIIEGIGPRINTILQEAGIRTFSQLAETEVSVLEQILRAANLRIANPGTWPEQARLAAAGDWSGLETLQGTLKAGRRG